MSRHGTPSDTLKDIFFAECEDLLGALQGGLHEIELGQQDEDAINILFRAVHSIKGGAGAFGLDAMVHFAHRFESYLDVFRQDGSLPGGPELATCFRASDVLSDLVQASKDAVDLPEAQLASVLAELDANAVDKGDPSLADEMPAFEPVALDLDLNDPVGPDSGTSDNAVAGPSQAISDPATRKFVITFRPTSQLIENGHEPARLLRALHGLGPAAVTCHFDDVPPLDQLVPEAPVLHWTVELETVAGAQAIEENFEFVTDLCDVEITTSSAGGRATPTAGQTGPKTQNAISGPPRPRASAPPRAIRVDLDRIERLVNLVGELVINQAMLAQSLTLAGHPTNSAAMNGMEEFHRLTRDIQDSVMMIRAQQVKGLFQRMARVVREASAQTGKQVRLITSGDAVEVDKTVLEALVDPLSHMIRNAVDHGIEHPAERVAKGKPECGELHLSAAHKSGRVILEVRDDGAGIDRDKVLKRAIEKELADAQDRPSPAEIDNLLFEPGFSTATSVSDLSGRGVGLDVVKTAVMGLGGKIGVRSDPGVGTRMSVSLPLTLAVLDGMVIEVAAHSIVVPLNVVAETMNLSSENIFPLQPGITAVRSHAGLVPLWDLGASLGYRDPLSQFEDKIAMLITDEEHVHAALVVDNIADQRQVVIKGLDNPLCQAPGIAAATILGDGRVALILDPASLSVPLPGAPLSPGRPGNSEVRL